MKNLQVRDIIEQCNGKLIIGNVNIECVDFCTDTRKIKKDDTYVGLKGEKFNGSEFYKTALELGAKVCILQDVTIDEKTLKKYNDRAIILVQDTLKALQSIAKYKRSLYNIPVIAITGSVGKTSTKDIIASVVSTKYKTLKTEGNFNNHIGVPLTILRLKDEEAMVVEMGMSNLGEISLLTNIAKPTTAVITNVGTAHIGNLGSRENILKAKLEILEGLAENGTLIINNDNDMLHMWNEKNKKYKVMDFGIKNKSDIMPENIELQANESKYDVKINDKYYDVIVPVGGEPFIYNSLCAICVGETLNIETENIISGIKKFELTKNRMEVSKVGSITIINDCYNANFDSMKAGIENLSKMKANRKIAILGDMLELGEFSEKLHKAVGEGVAKNKIDILITVGTEAKNIAKEAENCGMKKDKIFEFNSNNDVVNFVINNRKDEDCILIKASNGMHFIEIVNELKKQLK